jgi:hypothetical protein
LKNLSLITPKAGEKKTTQTNKNKNKNNYHKRRKLEITYRNTP